jgi:hypothetical protein
MDENIIESDHENNIKECCICLEEKDSIIKTNCNHIFCEKCLLEWFSKGNNTCPLCRNQIDSFSNNSLETRVISINNSNREYEINTSLRIIQGLLKNLFKYKCYLFLSLSTSLYYIYLDYSNKTNLYYLRNLYEQCETNLTTLNEINNSDNLIYGLLLKNDKLKECLIPEYYQNKCFENSFN